MISTIIDSTIDMDSNTWQQSALVAMDHISEQRSQRELVNNTAIADLLSTYDDVVFDFSAWVEATAECTSPSPISPTSSTSSNIEDLLTVNWYNMVTGRVTDKVHTLNVANVAPKSVARSPFRDYYYDGDEDESNSSADDEESSTAKDIGAVYEWCVEQAQESGNAYKNGQSIFRFEFGRYQSAEQRASLLVIEH